MALLDRSMKMLAMGMGVWSSPFRAATPTEIREVSWLPKIENQQRQFHIGDRSNLN